MKIWGDTKIQESNLQQALQSSLGEAESVKEMTVSSLEAFTRKVFADELDKTNKKKFWKTRLTWSSNDRPPAPDDKIVGEWNQRLPYISSRTWVVQNCSLMNAAGKRITLEDLSDSKHTWVDKHGTAHIAPSDRQIAAGALDVYRKDALAEDPLFCAFCVTETYRAKDWDDRTRHIYRKHPLEFAQMVGIPIEAKVDMVSVIPDREETQVNAAGALVCCGKEFSSIGRLNQHRAISKNHKG